jgi:LPS O-antigen subunit length determinant protein (WzzB/FepE family)
VTEQTATRPDYDDEIDLIELCKNLWAERITIVVCMIIVTAAAVAYLLLAKPSYEVSMQLTPPSPAILEVFKPNMVKPTQQSTDPQMEAQLEILKLILATVDKTTSLGAGDEFTLFLDTLHSDTHPRDLHTIGSETETNSNQQVYNNKRKITSSAGRGEVTKDYRISVKGYDRQILTNILKKDIANATQTTNQILTQYYIAKLEKLLEQVKISDDLTYIAHTEKEIEKLQKGINTLSFSSGVVNAPDKPVSPNAKLVIIIGIVLGGLLGFLIAIGKIAYNNYTSRAIKPV